MTREPTITILDAAIRTMFDERADRADDAGLRGDILSVTAAQPQARGWRLSLPAMFPPGLARVVILAILAVALGVASIVAFGAVSDEPVPTGPTTSFIRPFVYATPDDPTIRMTAIRREVVVWISGPDIPNAPNINHPTGGSGAAGIAVGSAETAWSHGGPGRFIGPQRTRRVPCGSPGYRGRRNGGDRRDDSRRPAGIDGDAAGEGRQRHPREREHREA